MACSSEALVGTLAALRAARHLTGARVGSLDRRADEVEIARHERGCAA